MTQIVDPNQEPIQELADRLFDLLDKVRDEYMQRVETASANARKAMGTPAEQAWVNVGMAAVEVVRRRISSFPHLSGLLALYLQDQLTEEALRAKLHEGITEAERLLAAPLADIK